MLIVIINGTYGHRPRLINGELSPFVVPVRPGDAPIEVDDEKAERLIRTGIAADAKSRGIVPPDSELAQAIIAATHAPTEAAEASDDEESIPEAGEATASAVVSAEMSIAELRAAMKEAGLSSRGMTKQQMLDALTAPDLTAEDVVE